MIMRFNYSNRSPSLLLLLLSSLVAVASSSTAAAAGRKVVVSSSSVALHQKKGGLSKVLSELSEEHECDNVATATLLFSRSVGASQRSELLASLVGEDSSSSSDQDAESDDDAESTNIAEAAVVGTASGLVWAQPSLPFGGGGATEDVVTSTAAASGGTVVFVPHPVDLQRGEGLFDDLAPAMEGVLSSGSKGTALIVVVPAGQAVDTAKAALEKAAESVLSNLAVDSTTTPITVLGDVFEKVLYVSSAAEAAEAVASTKVTIAEATDRVSQAATATAVTASGMMISSRSSAAIDLAAARKLGPAVREQLQLAVQSVQQVCRDNEGGGGSPKLVVNFGELCSAAMERALTEWTHLAQDVPGLLSSQFGNMLRKSLVADLDTELGELFAEQMEQLQMASFEDFKKGLSKLLVSPHLAADMDAQVKKSLAAFGAAAKKMTSRPFSWSIQPAKEQFRRSLQEHVQKRLLAAKAAGQFKPLPRKGVTVGMHWLLPKPFGNDYRQEPWMVHATDSMVYVPKDKKISDVSPEQVASGDWRRKIVPSPVGNEMIYMQ